MAGGGAADATAPPARAGEISGGSARFSPSPIPGRESRSNPAQAWLRAVVRVEFCHHGRFDAKQRQFDDHAVVVAEAPDGGVVGVVCVAVKKNVTVAGQARTAGYVSGLRVASTWQRKGVGRLLAGRAEAAAADRGVDYLYVSVNASNPRARRFFADRGYAVAARAGTRGAFADSLRGAGAVLNTPSKIPCRRVAVTPRVPRG